MLIPHCSGLLFPIGSVVILCLKITFFINNLENKVSSILSDSFDCISKFADYDLKYSWFFLVWFFGIKDRVASLRR